MEVTSANVAAPAGSRVLSTSLCHRVSPGFTLNVQLTFLPGITVLFGASGAGKSTLLDCLAGLIQPDRGIITIGNRVLFDSNAGTNLPARSRRAGYLLQSLALFPHLSARANVEFGIAHMERSEREERSISMLKTFHVEHLAARRPGEISGGERQRVALARALVTDPDFLLLDEPLSGLDAVTTTRIINDLRGWNSGHQIPIVYVTHDRDEVSALADRIVVLENGSVIAEGNPSEVLHQPTSESVAQLAGFENIFDATVISVEPDQGSTTCELGSALHLQTPITAASPGTRVRLGIRAGDILLATEPPTHISARNIFPGMIASLEQSSRFVVARVDCGQTFEVHLTRAAVESLELRANRQVWLVIKSHSCHLLERT
jgi:molybdate transport system ATP-binding protein